MEFCEYEPPNKMMKYEDDTLNKNVWKSGIELVQFNIGYVTKKGNIFLEKTSEDNDTLLIDSNNKLCEVYILNFQTFEGGESYLISNPSDNITNIDINKGYTIREIFNNFMNGYYSIGILHCYYKNNNKNGIITDISTFNDDSNSELRLHYTKNKNYYGNVAWRTIKWDLFEDFVPNDN